MHAYILHVHGHGSNPIQNQLDLVLYCCKLIPNGLRRLAFRGLQIGKVPSSSAPVFRAEATLIYCTSSICTVRTWCLTGLVTCKRPAFNIIYVTPRTHRYNILYNCLQVRIAYGYAHEIWLAIDEYTIVQPQEQGRRGAQWGIYYICWLWWVTHADTAA